MARRGGVGLLQPLRVFVELSGHVLERRARNIVANRQREAFCASGLVSKMLALLAHLDPRLSPLADIGDSRVR